MIGADLCRFLHHLIQLRLLDALDAYLKANFKSHIHLLDIANQLNGSLHLTILDSAGQPNLHAVRGQIHRHLKAVAVPRDEELFGVRLALAARAAEGFWHGICGTETLAALDLAAARALSRGSRGVQGRRVGGDKSSLGKADGLARHWSKGAESVHAWRTLVGSEITGSMPLDM